MSLLNKERNEFRYITTEQISKYHPDKYADQISDIITTELLKQNPYAKVAVETLVKDEIVVIAGEISGAHLPNYEYERLIEIVANDLGYKVDEVINLIGEQSEQIRLAVEQEELGAGDQGIMFGYATRETPSYLPLGVHIADKIIHAIEERAKEGNSIYKGDAKTQVTIDTYTNTIDTIVVSVCHVEDITDIIVLRLEVLNLIKTTLKDYDLRDTKILVNPAGLWTKGGPAADSGLTGRKIVADQYGPYLPVGGGAFSGKDLTKVDRSAAYMARLKAVEILEKNPKLDWVKIHVGYAIGEPYPVSLSVLSNLGVLETFDTLKEDFKVDNLVKTFRGLNLYKLSQGGHFRDTVLLETPIEKPEMKIDVPEYELMTFLVRSLRYGMERNGELEPVRSIADVKKYFLKLTENKEYWARLFLREIREQLDWDFEEKIKKHNLEALLGLGAFLEKELHKHKENKR